MDLTRRDFLLGGGAAFGGILATSALPAFADNPALFPQRGRCIFPPALMKKQKDAK